jgi:ribosomal protein L12E/L44/L45/RPP1/RPP2
MKRWFLFAVFISVTLRAAAYVMPVIDTANLEQQVQNEYQNLTQYLSTVTNTLRSAQQLEQQVTQLGSYASINNLPGVGTIGQVVGDGLSLYRQTNGIYGQIQGLTNPGQFTGQFQALLSRYGNYQNLLNGVTVYGPVSNQYTIPMSTATAQAVNGYQNALTALNNQRNQLELQLASPVSQLQAATTQAEVEKLNGQIAALSGQLNSVNEQIQQAAATSAQVAQQNQAAANAVQQGQDALEAADLEKGASGYTGLLQFNSQPGD